MPFPNYHACRIVSPDKFVKGSVRTKIVESVKLILGKVEGKDGSLVLQAVRYPKSEWTEAKARGDCDKKKGIKFEAAGANAAALADEVWGGAPDLGFDLSEIDMAMLMGYEDVEEIVEAGGISEFAFIEQTPAGRYAVKRREGAFDVVEVFDDLRLAKALLWKLHAEFKNIGSPMDEIPVDTTGGGGGGEKGPIPAIGLAEAKKAAKALPTETLKGVPIFAAGRWRDMSGKVRTWTQAHLAQIVDNFKALKGVVRPHLKFSHLKAGDHKKVTGLLSLGWVTNLREKGGVIYGDIENVPSKIADLIRAKSLGRPSAEIFMKWKNPNTGKSYENVLSAVGILGAQHPAVNTIDDWINKVLHEAGDGVPEAMRVPVIEFGEDDQSDCWEFTETEIPGEGGEREMEDLKAMQERDARIRKALGLPEGEDLESAFETMKESGDSAVSELKTFHEKDDSRRVESLLDAAKKAGKLVPAQEGFVRVQLSGDLDEVLEFTDGDGKTVKASRFEMVKAYLEGLPKIVNFGEAGEQGEPGEGPGAGDADEIQAGDIPEDAARYADAWGYGIDMESIKVDRKIRAHMEKHEGASYSAATAVVLRELKLVEPEIR